MSTINIAFICDENYAMPTAVAITSLKRNQSTKHDVNVFVLGVDLKEASVKKINSLNSCSCKVKVMQMELSKKQKDVIAKRERVTHASLFKFDLPTLFPQYDKMLYLDSDVIVQKDLEELFATDISNCYAAVTKDVLTFRGEEHLRRIRFNHKTYFNSGVMLLNLQKMRSDDIPNKLLDYRLNNINFFMDQDSFNIIFDGNIKFIHPYYNLLNCFFEWESIEKLKNFYSTEFPKKICEIYKNATILHFGDSKKPWIYKMGYLSKLYKKYHRLSPYAKTPLKLKRAYFRKKSIKFLLSEFIHNIPPFKGIYFQLKNIQKLNDEYEILNLKISEQTKRLDYFILYNTKEASNV